MTNFTPSRYQEAIFEWVRARTGSAIIEAVAGSGKSTTLVEAAKFLPPSASVLFVAFNKSIATELARRLPPTVEARTLNSLGYRAWLRHSGTRPDLDTHKTWKLIDTHLTATQATTYGGAIRKLVALAKGAGIPYDSPDGADDWLALADLHNIAGERGGTDDELVTLAKRILAESVRVASPNGTKVNLMGGSRRSSTVIDFDDQLYLPVMLGAKFEKFDVVMVDEFQDLNAVQWEMVRRSLTSGGRFIVAGDVRQGIYSFRGAAPDTIDKIATEFACVRLPLSISYRCPRAVVTEAQKLAPEIESHPDAPQGSVTTHEGTLAATHFTEGDAVLCRFNAPIVTLAYKLIRAGVSARVLGREIGKGLDTLITKLGARDLADLSERLTVYYARESTKLLAKGEVGRVDALADRVQTIEALIDELPEGATIERLREVIASLFSDDAKARSVTLATVHKAKGLEWDRVWILDPHKASTFATQPWMQTQETNIRYTAITRARRELRYVRLDQWGATMPNGNGGNK